MRSGMAGKKDCSYPNCYECQYEDCIVDNVNALLKRRRWNANPEVYRQKQRDYRSKVAESLPHCDECNECTLVKLDKGTGFKRLCVPEMRLILQKVTCCPQWCPKKIPVKEREHQRYLRRKELKAGEKTDPATVLSLPDYKPHHIQPIPGEMQINLLPHSGHPSVSYQRSSHLQKCHWM